MSELKACPFCGEELRYFGVDIRDNQKIPIYKHPDEDITWERCPLSGLVFDKYRWEKRPIEDTLQKEIIILKAQFEQYTKAPSEDWQQKIKDYRVSLRALNLSGLQLDADNIESMMLPTLREIELSHARIAKLEEALKKVRDTAYSYFDSDFRRIGDIAQKVLK